MSASERPDNVDGLAPRGAPARGSGDRRLRRPPRRGADDERPAPAPAPAGSGRPGTARRPRGGPAPDPARDLAFEALRAITEQDAYANLLLPGLLRRARLDARDAAFATGLVYGTLRARGTLDAVLTACLDRTVDQLDPPARDVLRLGAYQLLVLETPSHAGVSTSVDLARRRIGPAVSRLVNAVLRRVAERGMAAWIVQVAPDRDVDPIGHLAIAGWHPAWIVSAFRDALDGSLTETAAALAADNIPPRITLVARPGRITRAELLDEVNDAVPAADGHRQPDPDEAILPEGEDLDPDPSLPDSPGPATGAPGRWSPLAVVIRRGDPGGLAAVRRGRAGVQDEGSQLVALAVAGAPTAGPDTGWWLDACAGPGGKAVVLAGLAAARGARLLAVDLQPHRARLVAGALRTSRYRPHALATELASVADATEPADSTVTAPALPVLDPVTLVADSTHPAWADGVFDRVLVDAPCSGLGSLRRRPEARWRRQPGDLPGLRAIQTALLVAALRAVRPGGIVGYATCSPHPVETSVVVADALRTAQRQYGLAIERMRTPDTMPSGLDLPAERSDAQLWPHRHGTDAMYLALLRRPA